MNYFSQSSFCYLVCLGIFLFFLIAAYRLCSNCTAIQKNIRDIPSCDEKNGNEKVLDDFFVSRPEYSALWKFYKENFIKLDVSTPPQTKTGLFSTASSAEYFNRSNCLETKINFGIYQALPSILTGMGIFFTFLGLAPALTHFGDFSSSINELSKEAFFSFLLADASLAFWSSIVGLGCSLLFSSILKIQIYKIDKALDKVTTDLDLAFPVITSQELDLAIARNSEVESSSTQQMCSLLEEFTSATQKSFENLLIDLTAKFSEGLDKKLKDSSGIFTEAAVALRESLLSINEVTKDTNSTISQLSQGLTKSFEDSLLTVKEINKEIQTQFQNTQKILNSDLEAFRKSQDEQLNHLLENVSGKISSVEKNLSVNFQILSKDICGGLESTSRNLLAVNTQTVSASVQNMQAVQKGIEESLIFSKQKLKESQELLLETQKHQLSEFNSFFQKTHKALLEEITADFEVLHSNYRSSHEEITAELSTQTKELGKLANTIGRKVNQLDKSIEESTLQINSVVNEIAQGTITSINEEFSKIEERRANNTKQQLSAIDSSAQALLQLSSKAENITLNSLDQFSSKLHNLESTFDHLLNSFDEILNKEKMIDKGIIEAMTDFQEKVVKLSESIDTTRGSLELVSKDLSSGTSSLGTIIGSIPQLIDSIKESAVELEKASVKMQENLAGSAHTIDLSTTQFSQELSNSLEQIDMHLSRAIKFLGDSIHSWNQKN